MRAHGLSYSHEMFAVFGRISYLAPLNNDINTPITPTPLSLGTADARENAIVYLWTILRQSIVMPAYSGILVSKKLSLLPPGYIIYGFHRNNSFTVKPASRSTLPALTSLQRRRVCKLDTRLETLE